MKEKRKKEKRKKKRRAREEYARYSPEIPDGGKTSDILGSPSGLRDSERERGEGGKGGGGG